MNFFSNIISERMVIIPLFCHLSIMMAMVLTACGTMQDTSQTPSPVALTPSLVPEATNSPEGSSESSAKGLESTVTSRTPVPTPTPGIIDREIDNLEASLGLINNTFLGLPLGDWLNLILAGLVVVASYFLGFKFLVWFLKWIAKRLSRDFDESVLRAITPDLKALLLVWLTRFAVSGLDFLSDEVRMALGDLLFTLEIVLIAIIAIKLINLGLNREVFQRHTDIDPEKLDRVIKTIQRLGDIIVVIIASSIVMSHFGIGAGAFAMTLIIIGLLIYFGARGIIADFVAGFILMADRPFRINDAVQIKELDTWGVVQEIGTRATRVRTRDGREVIIPNSQINDSLVINYTYPDPRFRSQTEFGVAYGSDVQKVRQVAVEAVRGIEGVLPRKNVDVLFLEFGDTAWNVRVRWWVGDYRQERFLRDQVNIALEQALTEAGIDLPFNTYNLNVKMEDDKPDQVSSEKNQDSQDSSN